ncbi:hypothetical protein AAFN85_02925 [Mucilaginibacter sp. CAU 1740]|uniref:hypothetical protein n=1 Tax=Mucilaginibacter sp. CAU 1740 TaxID=3140365 RepID=UPI00325C2610
MSEETKFLHAIDLNNQQTCQFIVQSGSINSLMQLGFWTELPMDYYHYSLEELRDNADQIFEKAVSPRGEIMFLASQLRKGLTLKVGGNPRELTDEAKEKLLRKSDLELEMERGRRLYKHDAPGRLTCLYFAEDNDEGRANLGRMLAHFKQPYLLDVRVMYPTMADHRVDNRWYEAYADDPKEEYLEKYWVGEPFNDLPAWEYLLEGSLMVADAKQRRYVELYGSWQE